MADLPTTIDTLTDLDLVMAPGRIEQPIGAVFVGPAEMRSYFYGGDKYSAHNCAARLAGYHRAFMLCGEMVHDITGRQDERRWWVHVALKPADLDRARLAAVSPPSWIVNGYHAAVQRDGGRSQLTVHRLTEELVARLPVSAISEALDHPTKLEALEGVVAALSRQSPAVRMASMWLNACAALDAAGVPRVDPENGPRRVLDVPGRIYMLAKARDVAMLARDQELDRRLVWQRLSETADSERAAAVAALARANEMNGKLVTGTLELEAELERVKVMRDQNLDALGDVLEILGGTGVMNLADNMTAAQGVARLHEQLTASVAARAELNARAGEIDQAVELLREARDARLEIEAAREALIEHGVGTERGSLAHQVHVLGGMLGAVRQQTAAATSEARDARHALQLFIERVARAAEMPVCDNADHAVIRIVELMDGFAKAIAMNGQLAAAGGELELERAGLEGQMATLNDAFGTTTLELEATRKMAAGAADNLDRERRSHQDTIGALAAAELEFEAIDAALDAGGIGRAFDRFEERPATRQQRIEHVIAMNAARGTRLDEANAKIAELEGEVETLTESRDAATGEAEHNERELVELRRRFDDLQRDRDRLARDLNSMQGDLDTAERKLRDAERDLADARRGY